MTPGAKEGVLNKIREAAEALSYDEAAAFLGISRRSLERIVAQRPPILKVQRYGARVCFDPAELERFRARQTEGKPSNVVAWRGRNSGGRGRTGTEQGGSAQP